MPPHLGVVAYLPLHGVIGKRRIGPGVGTTISPLFLAIGDKVPAPLHPRRFPLPRNPPDLSDSPDILLRRRFPWP